MEGETVCKGVIQIPLPWSKKEHSDGLFVSQVCGIEYKTSSKFSTL